jgi:hypothetical protein
MLLSPLHLTSYCIWDHLKQQNWFGAEQIIIVSASSKTSLGVAVALDRDDAAPTVVGLTSQANKQFVADTLFTRRLSAMMKSPYRSRKRAQ